MLYQGMFNQEERNSDLNKELELEEQKGEEDFSSDQSSVTAPSAAPPPACAAGLKDASQPFPPLQLEALL